MFLVGAANGYSMQMGGAVRVSRAAMSKLAAPRMDITVEKSGEFGTTDFTMYFKKVREDLACRAHRPTGSGASHTLPCVGACRTARPSRRGTRSRSRRVTACTTSCARSRR